MRVAIIGQGYVGLPLAQALVAVGHAVHGIDYNLKTVESLMRGISHVEDISNDQVLELLDSKLYFPTSEFEAIKECEIVIICVPTPLGVNHLPDLTYLESAIDSIAEFLQVGVLIILESTSFPGTTREFVFNRISKMRGWTGQDFYCAFSPERVDPLNKDWNLRNTPKLVSGINVASQEKAIEFYETFVDRVVSTQKIEIAEFAKLIENAYRLVNISFVNEMSKLASAVGLSIVDILDAASTKPYGFQRFNPGLGAGGHCIPVDPVYLHKFAQDKNIELPILKEAIKTNNRLPLYHATQINNLLNGNLDPNRKVLLVGISYKPGVADLRESQSVSLLRELEKFGIDTYWEDPLASNSPFGKKHDHRNVYDVVVLNHSFLSTDRYQIQPKGHFYVVS